MQQELSSKGKEIENRKIGAIFKGNAGKEVLEILRQRFIETTIAKPGEDISEAYYRQGKADAIRFLERMHEDYKKEL